MCLFFYSYFQIINTKMERELFMFMVFREILENREEQVVFLTRKVSCDHFPAAD